MAASTSRAESRERTRVRLVEAAAAVFADQGFAAASLEAIAERAGYTRGAVYANFAGKEDLFFAVLDRELADQITDSERIRAEHPDPAAAFAELRRRGGNRLADRDRYLLLTEFRLYALRNPSVSARLAAHERRQLAWFAAAVTGAAAGRSVAAERLALIVLALENGIATLAHTAPDTVRPDAFVDALELLAPLLAAGLAGRDQAGAGPVP